MNREAIEARKAALAKELEQAVNRANMCLGAIGECDYWLQQLAEGAGETSPPAEIGGENDDDGTQPD